MGNLFRILFSINNTIVTRSKAVTALWRIQTQWVFNINVGFNSFARWAQLQLSAKVIAKTPAVAMPKLVMAMVNMQISIKSQIIWISLTQIYYYTDINSTLTCYVMHFIRRQVCSNNVYAYILTLRRRTFLCSRIMCRYVWKDSNLSHFFTRTFSIGHQYLLLIN